MNLINSLSHCGPQRFPQHCSWVPLIHGGAILGIESAVGCSRKQEAENSVSFLSTAGFGSKPLCSRAPFAWCAVLPERTYMCLGGKLLSY